MKELFEILIPLIDKTGNAYAGWALIIVCALLKIRFSEWSYMPTEVLTVAAASAVSWLQAKRYSELSTSYALTAHEINIVRARGALITTESDLSQYVCDTENAFSREHTQWAARRDAICRTSASTGQGYSSGSRKMPS